MKKIPSLFKRNYEGDRLMYADIVEGSKWVLSGEGVPTVKIDGTCCKVVGKNLYKRQDRKLTKSARSKQKRNKKFIPATADFKTAQEGWIACEQNPNLHTGHWPGWLLVGDEPQDKWHREGLKNYSGVDGTCELVGPKIQGNPYEHTVHKLISHSHNSLIITVVVPTDFEELKNWFISNIPIEGIVWHHKDGRMVKVKRSDFGLQWPIK